MNMPEHKRKELGRDGVVYTVKGKGWLVREVIIPTHLTKELELRRLPDRLLFEIGAPIIISITKSQPEKDLPTSLPRPVSRALDSLPVSTAYAMGMHKCGWMNSIPVKLPDRNEW